MANGRKKRMIWKARGANIYSEAFFSLPPLQFVQKTFYYREYQGQAGVLFYKNGIGEGLEKIGQFGDQLPLQTFHRLAHGIEPLKM